MNKREREATERRLASASRRERQEPGFLMVPVIQASQSRRRRFDPVAVAGWGCAAMLCGAFWAVVIAWAVP